MPVFANTSEFTHFARVAKTLNPAMLVNLREAMREGGGISVSLARSFIPARYAIDESTIRTNTLSYQYTTYSWSLISHTRWERITPYEEPITLRQETTVLDSNSVFSAKNSSYYSNMHYVVEHPSPFDLRHCMKICIPRYHRLYSWKSLILDLAFLHAPSLLGRPGLFHKHCRCYLIPADQSGRRLIKDEERAEHFDHGDINARLLLVMKTMVEEVMPLLLKKAFDTTTGGFHK